MSMMGYWDSLVRGAASPASIEAMSIPFKYKPNEYLGIGHDGLHRFSNRLGVVSADEDFLAYILAHPDLGPLHAEAMERAKA